MNCLRARKLLPLLVGADLPPGKARRLEVHLEGCPSCRREVEELRASLAGIRAAAGREALDWTEGEWKGLMARVRSEKPRPRPAFPLGAVSKKAWAYGFVMVLVLGITGLILRAILSSPGTSLLSEVITVSAAQPSRASIMDKVPSGGYPQDLPFSVRKRQAAVSRTVLAAGPAPQETAQDLMSLTLVSQETGLKVHWTFNRNFEWEEKKQ